MGFSLLEGQDNYLLYFCSFVQILRKLTLRPDYFPGGSFSLGGTEMVQVTVLRRTLSSSP